MDHKLCCPPACPRPCPPVPPTPCPPACVPPRPPCGPQDCQCSACQQLCQPSCPPACSTPFPPMGKRPFPPHGFLLPRIIASGREWQRRACLKLMVEGVPACAVPPWTLLSVTACGTCRWEILPCEGSRQWIVRVTYPVACLVRDGCGSIHTGHSEICTDVTLRLPVPPQECWRNSLVAFPCVRLVCAACGGEEPVFDATLEVLVEVWMTRWEPCMVGVPQPVCPDLPLYPQPRL